jgi:hypothetical protein
VQAATQTAQTNPACSITALPEGFYWEIGDASGALASGSVAGNNTPTATQRIAVASASKWVYSTYVLQKVGSLRESDVPFLNFTSGYISPFSSEATCGFMESVGDCAAGTMQRPTAVDEFFYSAGHFQHHGATVMGLGSMRAAALTTEISSTLEAPNFLYVQTNLAGGLNASAADYAAFLRRMLNNGYVMSSHLGTRKVCASAACAAGAVLSPAPPQEAWNYSLGHWVEDDPQLGDGALSSAGALGFYPWMDASRTWYGVLSRRAAETGGNQGFVSVACGRLIRQAWVTGVTVTQTTPTPTP